MPKKKERMLALEVVEINPTWDYRQSKILQNFVCKKDEAEKVIADMDLQEYWKHEKKYGDEVKAILAAPGTRNASNVFFHDEVIVEEPKFPSSIKPGTKYVYKIYDYFEDRAHTEYGTQKDIVAYINKKIKTKYAYVSYNGTGCKIEYSPKSVTDILNELEKTTSQFIIEPLGRSGTTDDSMVVSIFKNCVK